MTAIWQWPLLDLGNEEPQRAPHYLHGDRGPSRRGVGLALRPAAPAAAASASCTGFTEVSDGRGGFVEVPSVGGNVNCLLGVGNFGEAVSVLQGALDVCYGSGIAQDADFGPQTKAALQAAQRREGITQDGVYGPQTFSHLQFEEIGVNAPGCSRVG